MPSYGPGAAASTSKNQTATLPIRVHVANYSAPVMGKTDVTKGWSPAHERMAATAEIHVFFPGMEEPLRFAGVQVNYDAKNPGKFLVWSPEPLANSFLKDERGGAMRYKPFEWNREVRSAVMSVINDENSPYNYDPNDKGVLNDIGLAHIHSQWWSDMSTHWPEMAAHFASLGYPGALWGLLAEPAEEVAVAVEPEPEPEPVAVPASLPNAVPIPSAVKPRTAKPAAAPALPDDSEGYADPFAENK